VTATIIILSLVTVQRLAELVIARRNTAALIARGAHEIGERDYPLIVAVHVTWLTTLWLLAPGRPIFWLLIAVFVLLQCARLWVLVTLGRRWTTRIIVLPGAPLVTGGPYRFLRHPNYAVVVGEIAVLPLAFGLVGTAILFSILNAAVLTIRIRSEVGALAKADALTCRLQIQTKGT
jgi:methyltransferase